MPSTSHPDARRESLARKASIVAAALFAILVGFQVALAAGTPWGRAAWGGGAAHLASGLRVASAISAVVLAAAALVVLRRGGHAVRSPLPDRWLRASTWVLTGYTALGVLANGASRSDIERNIWAPVSLVLAVTCAMVAAWGAVGPRRKTTSS